MGLHHYRDEFGFSTWGIRCNTWSWEMCLGTLRILWIHGGVIP